MEWLSVPDTNGRVVVSPLTQPEIERIRRQWYDTGHCGTDVIPHLIATIDALNETLIGIIQIGEDGSHRPNRVTTDTVHPGQRVCQQIARNTLMNHSVPVESKSSI
jgi:hypothetical protein